MSKDEPQKYYTIADGYDVLDLQQQLHIAQDVHADLHKFLTELDKLKERINDAILVQDRLVASLRDITIAVAKEGDKKRKRNAK